jgi:hypothetical protein
MQNFVIDPKLLTSVLVSYERVFIAEDLSQIPDSFKSSFDGTRAIQTTGWEDPSEFTQLRNLLHDQGFIKKEPRWWNGDRVLQAFTLNGHHFSEHEQFPCAEALGLRIKYATKTGAKTA